MLMPRNAMIAPAAIVKRTREPPPPARMANAITPTPRTAIADADVGDVRREHAGAAARTPRAARRSAARASPSRPGATEATSAAPRPTARGSSTLHTMGIVSAAVGRSTPTRLEERVQADREQDAEADPDHATRRGP